VGGKDGLWVLLLRDVGTVVFGGGIYDCGDADSLSIGMGTELSPKIGACSAFCAMLLAMDSTGKG
jgi:hypothetical protein